MANEQSDRGPRDWRTLHVWQIQPVRDVLLLALVAWLVYLGYVLSVVTVPLLLAMALAYLFEPVVRVMTSRLGLRREVAVGGLIVGVVVGIGAPVLVGLGFGVLQGVGFATEKAQRIGEVWRSVQNADSEELRTALPGAGWRTLRDQLVELKRESERAEAQARVMMGSPDGRAAVTDPAAGPATGPAAGPAQATTPAPGAVDGASGQATAAGEQEPPDPTAVILFRGVTWLVERVQENAGLFGRQAIQTGAGAVQAALSLLTSVGFFFFGAFITGFFFFFVSVRYARVIEFLDSLVPVQNRALVRELTGQMDRVIAGFIRGRVTICAFFIVYFTIAYWLIGVPAPLALGPIVGLLCLVPYAATAGMIIAIALMWLEPSTAYFGGAWWWIIGAPALIHGAGQVLDDYILTPRIQGQSTGMDTPTILFASLAGAVLAGFYGVLLAIPVAACVKIALQRLFWPRFKAWAAGRASDPLPLKE